jgi:hypothetical protein
VSRKQHDDRCPGCRPALMNIRTQTVLPGDHPEMRAVNAVWEGTSLAERKAWHAVTCTNSRSREDLALAGGVAERMKRALAPFSFVRPS